jgi:succinylglutamate desuccinylase
MAGIHGNEAYGVEAAGRVARWLERHRPPLAGQALFLAGNLPALQKQSRFIDLDLNRQWTPEKVAALVNSEAGAEEPTENGQQRELLPILRDVVRSARGQLYFLDLHTCSAEGPPFVTIGDTLRNRRFAQTFPLPLILGLEEQVDGALHHAEQSLASLEAVLWLALVSAGILRAEDAPDLDRYRTHLCEASRGAPRVIEVRHRHATRDGDEFRMEPGYFNFKPVRKGEQLAHDSRGPILSPRDGLILLPLYQGQGEDGFFVSRVVRPFWLKISQALRRLRLYGLMRLLPGVRSDPDNPEGLIVDTNIARYSTLEVFHLFGFRKIRQNGTHLIVSRRRHDLEPPRRISLC